MGWGKEGREGRKESGRRAGALFFFSLSEIGIFSFTAELMGPDIELK